MAVQYYEGIGRRKESTALPAWETLIISCWPSRPVARKPADMM